MVTDIKTETQNTKNPIWWTAIIVGVTTTIIGTGLRMLTGAINSSTQEPSYFPLLFLIIAFFSVLLTLVIYRMVLPQLPSSWFLRGILVGAFLFVIGDLPYALISGFEMLDTGAIASRLILAALLNRLINGCILTYSYQRLSTRKDNQ